MLYYTIQGPKHRLEIHEDKIILVKKQWFPKLRKTIPAQSWSLEELAGFEVTVPKFFLIAGKIEWKTFGGDQGSLRFNTTPAMVKKIETYLQKRVIKNHQTHRLVV